MIICYNIILETRLCLALHYIERYHHAEHHRHLCRPGTTRTNHRRPRPRSLEQQGAGDENRRPDVHGLRRAPGARITRTDDRPRHRGRGLRRLPAVPAP